jgi:TPR repeat protein
MKKNHLLLTICFQFLFFINADAQGEIKLVPEPMPAEKGPKSKKTDLLDNSRTGYLFRESEDKAARKALDSSFIKDCEEYLEQYPNGAHVSEVEARLGKLEYMEGNKFYEKNQYVSAVSHLRKAAGYGYISAYYLLGYMYRKGEGVTENHVEAVSLFQKGAEAGHAESIYQLGICYYNGEGVESRNTEYGIKLLEEAAAKGSKNAKNTLSQINGK